MSIRPDGSEFILHVIDKYVQAEFESDFPDWAEDANAAVALCYCWAVEHGKDIMVSPKDDGFCQAVFMRSDYEHFEYWEPDSDIGWCKGTTVAEALARLALTALKQGAVAER